MDFLKDALFTKMKRFAHVGTTATGLAARMVGEKVFDKSIDNEAYAKALKSTLGNMKGPIMKVAQFLATIPDALPREYSDAFLELQSNAPSMGPFFVKRRMQSELGSSWQDHFKEFSLEASFAASLGQVHKATDQKGRLLALKLQYPQMESIVSADLANLKLFLKTYRIVSSALDLEEVYKEITERLKEELDYQREATNLKDFKAFFKNDQNVILPDVIEELTTPRLLTMSWLEGVPLLDFIKDKSPDECNHLAALLFKAWYRPFYLKGWIHGDPHPGNYKIGKNNELMLFDLGCMRRFSKSFVDGVINLYEALKTSNEEQCVYAYETWGFQNLSFELIEVMNNWAKLLYDPLLDDSIRPIQQDFSGAKGWETAVKVHKKLHELGGIRPPQEFVFMDRAAVGLGAVFMRLKATLNWHQLFEEILQERRLQEEKLSC